jgi:hypothetical protein
MLIEKLLVSYVLKELAEKFNLSFCSFNGLRESKHSWRAKQKVTREIAKKLQNASDQIAYPLVKKSKIN